MDIQLAPGGGLERVPGFKAQGVHAGLKRKRRDVALIVSERPCTGAAAVFTNNAFAAAPVQVSRAHLAKGDVRAVVVNSANANACTGKQGLQDAYTMTEVAADALGLSPHQVLVSSTGVIGHLLDMGKITAGIQACAGELEAATGGEAAEAIMTTDTHPKQVQVTVEVGGRTFHIGGMAKGSGMIHPNMATMLAFLTTDAPVASEHLQELLSEVVDASFNMITVDGDESTNDMVALLANGQEGGPGLRPGTPAFEGFAEGLHAACRYLAREIAADGEGASVLVEVEVDGAETLEDARAAARAIVRSNLVKAAIHGRDPNWGRIVAALGACGARVEPSLVHLAFEADGEQATVVSFGEPHTNGALDKAAALLENGEVRLVLDLGLGPHAAQAWGCDLTEEYVTFNAAYTS